jgi:GntR family transcriptional regulator, transcriptional repressor for pyruvate dehydrogenase complex
MGNTERGRGSRVRRVAAPLTHMRPGRRTLSQAVTEAVLDRIKSGEFRPGDRLPTEKDLMEEYEIGRNSAREAMQALVAMGVIDVRPGRGAVLVGLGSHQALDPDVAAALLTDKAVDDLYEFRQVLDLEIARTAALRATDQDIDEIRSVVERYDRAVEAGTPVSDIDDEFHQRVAQATHNTVFITMGEAITALIANARRLAGQLEWARLRAQKEHRELYEAIRAHKPEAAVKAASRHLEGALKAIQEGRAQLEGEVDADATVIA